MPWIIGIDEAGYGPNLGPFVMSSAACQVPEGSAGADLWQLLRQAVRRHREADDGRLLIEDSKLVYSTARGLRHLETGVLAVLGRSAGSADGQAAAPALADLIGRLAPAAPEALRDECWYTGKTLLPVEVTGEDLEAACGKFAGTCTETRIVRGLIRSVIICPPRFNALVDRWNSKGMVLTLGLAELLRGNHEPEGSDAVEVFIDKHGGRNNYAALLQQAVPAGMVLAEEEGKERSVYRVVGLSRSLRLTFLPRADSAHFCVALASMVSKYLRELLMLEFNRFWQAQVPGVKPTAGYPGDAARFFADIRPAVQRLGISESALWRCR